MVIMHVNIGEAKKIIDESGIQFTFLRPNDFMQNFVNFYNFTIKTNNAFYIPGGDERLVLLMSAMLAVVASQGSY